MNNPIHTSLAEGRWFTFSIVEQLANVGSEFERSASAFQRGDGARFEKAFDHGSCCSLLRSKLRADAPQGIGRLRKRW